MRTTRTLSITLPPDMLARVAKLARKQDRTMSELVREALRRYEHGSWWDEMNAYGRAKAGQLGLTESDVVPAVKAVRRQRQTAVGRGK